jgi:PAS domain S-box-containing protein
MCPDLGKVEIFELPVVDGITPASTTGDCFPQEISTSSVASTVQRTLKDLNVQQNRERLIAAIAARLHSSRTSGDLLKAVQAELEECLRSEAQFRETEQFLRSIYEGSDAPIWVINVLEDGTFRQGGLNPKAEYFTGLRAVEVVGKTPIELFGAEQGEEICQLFTACITLGSPLIYEECREFQGQIYWLSTTLTPLKNEAGRIYRLVGHSLDITARKEAEIQQQQHVVELSQWQNRYETAGEASGQILYEYDIQTDRPIWGPNTEKILGYSISEMPNGLENWIALIHPDDRQLFKVQRDHLMTTHIPMKVEYRFRRHDGDFMWLEDKSQFLSGQEDAGTRIVGFISDISDRKQAEAALAASETKFRHFVENISEVIFAMDREGFTYLSPQFPRLTGYEISEFLGRTPFEITHPEDQPFISAHRQAIMTQGIPNNMESRIYHKDGTLRWIEVRSVPIYGEMGGIEGIQGTVHDISAKKQAELKLQEANDQLAIKNTELARATKLKDEFLATMSHELRTPLNAILGNSEILLEEIHGDINDKQRKSLNSIERSGQHLLSLINDILDLSKIEAGQLELQYLPISVESLCSNSISFIQPQSQQKQIQLRTQIDPALPTRFQGDERRLRQVLINLLNNAVKFTPQGGLVSLTVQSNPAQQTLQFSVHDTGIGIAPEDLQKLFQSFVQIDSKLNRQYDGTGLGLTIVKRIVELHGGRVMVESAVGQGSCFTIELPWQQPSEMRAE